MKGFNLIMRNQQLNQVIDSKFANLSFLSSFCNCATRDMGNTSYRAHRLHFPNQGGVFLCHGRNEVLWMSE